MLLRKRSVSRHVIYILVGITAIVLAGLCALAYHYEKQQAQEELKLTTSIDADQLASGLALSVWNLDEAQARKNLESSMRCHDIQAIVLEAKGLPLVAFGRDALWNPVPVSADPGAGFFCAHTRQIECGGVNIGMVRVFVSDGFLLERLRTRLLLIVGVFVLFELILALSLSLLIWRSIMLPLQEVERYAVLVSGDSGDAPAPTKTVFRGEMETLRASIEKMVALLRDRFDEASREAALRSESEEQLRAVYDSVNDGIMIHEPDMGCIIDVNTRACELYGRTREQLLACSMDDISSGQNGFTGEESIRRIRSLDTGRPLLFEWQCRRLDGTLFWGEVSIRRTQVGGRELVLVVLRDISPRKLQEEEHHRLEVQLTQSQKLESLGILAGGIAHDFNNILGAIIGYCELAREDSSHDPALAEYFTEINKAAIRARDLVRQILTFSRRTKQEFQPVQLPQLVSEVLKLIRATFPASIEIMTQVPEALPLVQADPSQMHQVLMNLCSNAQHAMRGRKGQLTISLRALRIEAGALPAPQQMPSGDYLRLSVADTGHGMDEETMRHVFDPFFTTKVSGEGTGLGLAVVHGIIKAHHGQILIESKLEEGCVFHVDLPVLEGEVMECINEAITSVPGAGQKVLFVDDERPLCTIAEKLLRKLGYRPLILSDPRLALSMPATELATYGLLISDLSMPGLNGLELSRELLLRQPALPVIIMSGFISPENLAEARALGVKELLSKPLDLQLFSKAIARHVRH